MPQSSVATCPAFPELRAFWSTYVGVGSNPTPDKRFLVSFTNKYVIWNYIPTTPIFFCFQLVLVFLVRPNSKSLVAVFEYFQVKAGLKIQKPVRVLNANSKPGSGLEY